ncbi:MAG: hypothetical protein IPL78_00795 [Chloroflexi bacterium]|nr:hypothetical protein [Chloroflexota bacterium]
MPPHPHRTSQYQLLVTDESCVSSDAYEPNDSTGEATLLSNNSRVRASLCSDNDVDTYHIWAIAGQQLTLNYPTNNTGSTHVGQFVGHGQQLAHKANSPSAAPAGSQSPCPTTPSAPEMCLICSRPRSVRPPHPQRIRPSVYYSNASDLTRVAVITRTIEPILMGNGAVGGSTIATDLTRGKLYILDHFERIVRVNFDGTGHEIIIPDADPNDILRFANGLAVDEDSGRIYWMEPQLGSSPT